MKSFLVLRWFSMKSILIVLLSIFIAFSNAVASNNLYIAIDKDLCFTCNSSLVSNVLAELPDQINPYIIITGVTAKNLKFYKNDIDTIFIKHKVVYDTLNFYRNSLKIKNKLEFIITDLNNNNVQRYLTGKDLYKALGSINKASNSSFEIIPYKTIEFDDDYTLVSTISMCKNDWYVNYDKRQKKFLLLNLNDFSKHSFAIPQELPFITTRIDINDTNIRLGRGLNYIDFSAFVQNNDSSIQFIASVIDTIIDNSYPVFKYYNCTISPTGISNGEQVVMPENFIFHGNNEAIKVNQDYFVSVYDSRYHHSKHNSVKDSTGIFIELPNGMQDYTITINYTMADSLGGSKYGLFFGANYYLFDDCIYFINPQNNIFTKLTNNSFSNFLSPNEKLKAVFNSLKSIDKDTYLDGKPYNQNCLYSFASLSKNSKYYCVLLFESSDLNANDRIKYIIQFYNLKGDFVYELSNSLEPFSGVEIINSNDELKLIINDDEKLEISNIKVR